MSSLMSKLEGLLQSRSVAGIECVLSSDGIPEINYVVLKKEKNRLTSDSSGTKIKDIESLKTSLAVSNPVFLALNGRGIIHKKFAYNEGENEIALFNKVLPAANPADFYLQKCLSDQGSHIISVIRKNIADSILNELKRNGYHVIGCSLGPFSFQSLLPLLDNTATSRDVLVSGFKLSLGENEISSFQSAEGITGDTLKLMGGEEVKPETVIPFATAVQYFISYGREMMANIPSVADGNAEFRQKQIFKISSGVSVGFFLVALLVNFLLFSSFSEKANDYGAKVSANQNMIQRYEKLKAEVEEKQAFLEKTGLMEASRTSFYADQIARQLPGSIKLTQMNIFPLEKKSNNDDADITFIPKNIVISGNCKQSIELNEWIGILKKTEWVNEVGIINFSQDKSENTGVFSIEIKMK